ncbi:hypothetical protein [Pectobacterium carotovorum]|uniref:hypothetical protein n=1 Tax=Pectobacterium carotovorum TaxID=554 RepID=UPI0021C41B3A|nr:hypothetical protein [Pectobacterium carotovorum]GKW06307.1 hypothetical protein PEC301889_07900 [Pectobacterium carotovorum subsp. carotovorum]
MIKEIPAPKKAGIVVFTGQNLSSVSMTSLPRSTVTITGWSVLKLEFSKPPPMRR